MDRVGGDESLIVFSGISVTHGKLSESAKGWMVDDPEPHGRAEVRLNVLGSFIEEAGFGNGVVFNMFLPTFQGVGT